MLLNRRREDFSAPVFHGGRPTTHAVLAYARIVSFDPENRRSRAELLYEIFL